MVKKHVLYHTRFSLDSGDDIIFISEDSVQYRVPTFLLRATSNLLGPDTTSTSISVSRKADILTPALLMLTGQHPAHETPFCCSSLEELEGVVALLAVWDAQGPLGLIKTSLLGYLSLWDSIKCDVSLDQVEDEAEIEDSVPPKMDKSSIVLRLYGIAFKMGWEEEMQVLSAQTLLINLWDQLYAPALERIGSTALMTLMRFRRVRRDVFIASFDKACQVHKLPIIEGQEECMRFGLPTHDCASCCQKIAFPALLTQIRHKMFHELDLHPGGETLVDALSMDDWTEARDLWALKCECGKVVVDKLTLLKDVKRSLAWR